MKQPILSIIVPTRDSVQNLEKLFLTSIAKNTYNINNIELVFVADKDDDTTIHFLHNNKFIKALKFVKIIIREQSNNITKDYYNTGAKQSTGFFVMVGADDIQITTPLYDKILEKMKHGIIQKEGSGKKYFLLVQTTGCSVVGDAGACPFPIITRDSINLLGYFLAPEIIPGWGPDWYIHKIYNTLHKVALPATPINIRHVSKHSGDTTQNVEARYSKMAAISHAALNCKHNPKVYVEMVRAIFLIIAENTEQYTPAVLYEAFSTDELISENVKGAAPGTNCPDIFLKMLWGIQQTLHDNLNR
jgi:hypothetical protein